MAHFEEDVAFVILALIAYNIVFPRLIAFIFVEKLQIPLPYPYFITRCLLLALYATTAVIFVQNRIVRDAFMVYVPFSVPLLILLYYRVALVVFGLKDEGDFPWDI